MPSGAQAGFEFGKGPRETTTLKGQSRINLNVAITATG